MKGHNPVVKSPMDTHKLGKKLGSINSAVNLMFQIIIVLMGPQQTTLVPEKYSQLKLLKKNKKKKCMETVKEGQHLRKT